MVGLGSGGEDRWEGLLRRRRWRRRRGEGDAEVGEAAVVEGRTGGAAKREDIGTVDSREVGEVGAEDVGIGTRDGEAEEVEIVAGRATEEVRVTVVGGVEEGAVRTGAVEVEAVVTTARQARRAATSRRRAAISSRSTECSSAVVSKVVVVGGGSRAWEEKSGAGTGAWTDKSGSGTDGTATGTRAGAPRRELSARAGGGTGRGTVEAGTGVETRTGSGTGAGTWAGTGTGAEAGTIEAGGFSGDDAGDTKSRRATQYGPTIGNICRNSVSGSGAMGTWVELAVDGVAWAVAAAVAEVEGADGGGRAIPGLSEYDDDEDKVELDTDNF